MKKSLLLLILILFSLSVTAQNEFITVWKPSNASTTNIFGGIPSTATQIWFPGTGNNFNVAWEEAGFPTHNGVLSNISSSKNFLIEFGNPQNPVPANATYIVKVSNGNGNFEAVKFPDTFFPTPIDVPPLVNIYSGDAKKILNVSQWGNIHWNSMEFAFMNCQFLNVSATDLPDLSDVTTAQAMFFSSGLVGNSSISLWDTSSITNMAYMFGQTAFNQPLGNWDVSNVTDIRWMFHACSNFNQPLNSWNTSSVVRMDHVFHYCNAFNQDLSNWDTSNVTHMDLLFGAADIFNQDLGTWDLSSVVDGLQMLSGTDLSCSNWDKTLFGWSNNPNSPNNFNLGNVSSAVYTHPLAVSARNNLINVKGWTFSGDVYDPTCESDLSTSETIFEKESSIYPNPVSDFIYFKNIKNTDSYKIFDHSGRVVLQNHFNSDKNQIDVRVLSKGNYILLLKTKHSMRTFKFIKK
ncbi:hypothetical protein ASG31_16425 [Chryseobacterium sp. Leaf404]|uniref:BspA family leucine-rich repeat surface protein n=1 Tax=unclassified Chryseobacterium TaxID=2593645 RepID=UPI0006F6DE8B|nr:MULTISPECIES: BspA family leucine-rich repeat surface protein [unclassified Chryseobacterium]KQT21460.1 hypothetical protein ASG31_16425 [Chryseobacterium sp. Leaf404]